MLRYLPPLEMNIIGSWTQSEVERGESPASSSVVLWAFPRDPGKVQNSVWEGGTHSRISTCVSGHLKRVKKEPHHRNCLPPPILPLRLFLAWDHSLDHSSSFTTPGSQPFISPGSQQLLPTLIERSQFISPR